MVLRCTSVNGKSPPVMVIVVVPLPLAHCPQLIHRSSVAEQVGIGTDGDGDDFLDAANAATSVGVL